MPGIVVSYNLDALRDGGVRAWEAVRLLGEVGAKIKIVTALPQDVAVSWLQENFVEYDELVQVL